MALKTGYLTIRMEQKLRDRLEAYCKKQSRRPDHPKMSLSWAAAKAIEQFLKDKR